MSWTEAAFLRSLSFLPKVRAPSWYAGSMKVKRTSLGEEWMRRHEVHHDAVLRASWCMLLASLAAAVVCAAALVMLSGPQNAMYAVLPVLLVPLIAATAVMNAPDSFAKDEERTILRESPGIIGCLAMSMQLRPSLESAVAFAADRGEGVLASRLKEAMWASLTRVKGSLSEAVLDMTSSLSEVNDSLRQSMHLVMSATCERTREGMDRLLDKANSIALAGVRDSVDRYVASLSVPTMVLFALGTLLPIMMFSILPLMTLGTSIGTEATEPISSGHIAFLLLAVFPSASFLYSRQILQGNPVGAPSSDAVKINATAVKFLAAWAAAVVAAVLCASGDMTPYVLSGAAVLPPSLFLAWSARKHRGAGKRRELWERESIACLFQIGNRMTSGDTFERAFEDAASSRPGSRFNDISRAVLHRSRITGKELGDAIVEDGSFRLISPLLENAFVTVGECADRDPRFAGQVALNLAQMLSDLKACQGKVEEKLRGVVDMMRSTGLFFAPIVLGVTGALFGLIGGASSGGSAGILTITGLYIAQLSFVISYFTVFLMGDRSWKEVAYQFGSRTPVAFAVFVAVSLICRTGLRSLL
ncbi:hypothetical protein [Methanomassiliicoccus luminyensis]|uniref:hypothetical protein n=1 Tax=Methanomassiliicoccus luminyensis TaxID=1080712 RepID=UPI00035DC1EF|nr:hypothetical protein [Methanomassiliicoccus luminyensis]